MPSSADPDVKAARANVSGHTAAIFEACAFQDITGQRVGKIVKTLLYVEERVNALIAMWGPEALSHAQPLETEETDSDKKLLSGPQLAGQGVSQDDVDVLLQGGSSMSVNEIDLLFG